MPKIDAPTVAEHHSKQRAALLAAATTLLAEEGLDAITLAAVGSAAGLARSSVYQYFDSAPALLAAVIEDVMPRAAKELAEAVARARTPEQRIDAFVRATLDTATDPIHRSLSALAQAPLPAQCRVRISELHHEQFAPLRAAVAELDVPDPELTTRLIRGLIQAAAGSICDGARKPHVMVRTLELIHRGLGTAR
jgi:AcrR family transcriptional regulator